jgi:membrane associated rhomboid family serine protease
MHFDITPTVKNLLIANFGIFVLALILSTQYGIDINNYFGLHSYFSPEFKVYQFVSYIFMHAFLQGGQIYFWHILGNMFALFMFGPMLERYWGAKRFLFFYLFTGIGAGLSYWAVNAYEVYQLQEAMLTYFQNPGPDAFVHFLSHHDQSHYRSLLEYIDTFSEDPTNAFKIEETKQYVKSVYNQSAGFSMVGASGSVYGILMGFGLLFPNTILMLIFPPIPVKAKYMVGFYALMELYLQMQNNAGDNVAHFAHLSGMVFAYILVRYWKNKRDLFY